MIEYRKGDFIQDMEKSIAENKKRKVCCLENNIKFFEIEDDSEKEIENAYRWIDKSLRGKINEQQ